MFALYDRDAPKKPTNLTINTDLLIKAKELKINISSVLEQALAERLMQVQKDEWLQENSASIAAYNEHIGQYGVFGDSLRTF